MGRDQGLQASPNVHYPLLRLLLVRAEHGHDFGLVLLLGHPPQAGGGDDGGRCCGDDEAGAAVLGGLGRQQEAALDVEGLCAFCVCVILHVPCLNVSSASSAVRSESVRVVVSICI